MRDGDGLLARLIARDESAWREFLSRYRAIIYGSILKTLDLRRAPEEQAEDIFQEVLLKLLADDCRALRRFQGRAQITTWLARIAINATIDAIRQRRARRELSPPGDDEANSAEEVLKRIPVEPRILEQAVSRNLAGRLLEVLGEEDRLILKMYFFAGLKEREIADLLDVPLNTLSSRKARALEKLRDAASERLRAPSDGVRPGSGTPRGANDEKDPRGA